MSEQEAGYDLGVYTAAAVETVALADVPAWAKGQKARFGEPAEYARWYSSITEAASKALSIEEEVLTEAVFLAQAAADQVRGALEVFCQEGDAVGMGDLWAAVAQLRALGEMGEQAEALAARLLARAAARSRARVLALQFNVELVETP